MEGVRDKQTAHICPSCHGILYTDEEYRSHTCKSHGSEIPLHCSYCYSRFEDKDTLGKHLGEREQFSCEMCSLQLCSEPILQDHLESHPTCRKCGKLFGNEADLYRVCFISLPRDSLLITLKFLLRRSTWRLPIPL